MIVNWVNNNEGMGIICGQGVLHRHFITWVINETQFNLFSIQFHTNWFFTIFIILNKNKNYINSIQYIYTLFYILFVKEALKE